MDINKSMVNAQSGAAVSSTSSEEGTVEKSSRIGLHKRKNSSGVKDGRALRAKQNDERRKSVRDEKLLRRRQISGDEQEYEENDDPNVNSFGSSAANASSMSRNTTMSRNTSTLSGKTSTLAGSRSGTSSMLASKSSLTQSRPVPAPPRAEATRPKAAPRPRTTVSEMRETRTRRNKAEKDDSITIDMSEIDREIANSAMKNVDLDSSEYEEATDNYKPVTAAKKDSMKPNAAKRSASPRSRSVSPARRRSKRIKTKSVVSSTPLQTRDKRKFTTPFKEYPVAEPLTGNSKEKENISLLLTTLDGFDGIGKTLAHLIPGFEENAKAVAAFLLFIYKRQEIWKNKYDPKYKNLPLTNNKTMAENWFTNMYRELDRGTTYFRSNLLKTVLKKQIGLSADVINLELLTKVLYKSIVYRLVNRVETFAGFGNIPEVSEWPKFSAYISKKMGRGEKIFTAAHINMGLRRFQETMKWLNNNIESIAIEIAAQAEERSLKGCFEAIHSITNVGPFLAWQILCDLLECRLLGKCTDNQWTVLGNGAKEGLSMIFYQGFGNHGELGMTRMLRNLCTTDGPKSGFKALGIHFPAFLNQNLSLKNVEHALCEFSKYYKLALGLTGKERKYNDGTSRVAQDKALKCCVCEKNSKTKKKFLCVLCNQCFHLNCLPQRKGSTSSESFLCDPCQVNADLWKKEDFDFDEVDRNELKKSTKRNTRTELKKSTKM